MKRGLNRQLVIDEAVHAIEERGYSELSLRDIAARLGVKPASLYNHVKGIDEIYLGVMEEVSDRLVKHLEQAVADKDRDTAFVDSVVAYRSFAEENGRLYDAFVNIPKRDRAPYRNAMFSGFAPIRRLIKSFDHSPEDLITAEVALISFLHGSIEMTTGRSAVLGGAADDKMFLRIVYGFLKLLKGEGGFDLPYEEYIRRRGESRKEEEK